MGRKKPDEGGRRAGDKRKGIKENKRGGNRGRREVRSATLRRGERDGGVSTRGMEEGIEPTRGTNEGEERRPRLRVTKD